MSNRTHYYSGEIANLFTDFHSIFPVTKTLFRNRRHVYVEHDISRIKTFDWSKAE